MKLHLASDMHLEFWRPWHRPVIDKLPECDVLVLAGDIFQRSAFTDEEKREIWSLFATKANHVFYVPGNHEYYESDTRPFVAPPPIRQLRAGRVASVAHGQRFLGDSLWFPYGAGDEQFYRFMNDFRLIRGPVASWAAVEYGRTHTYLMEEVRPGDIVVTHHLPHPDSIPPQYRSSELNRFFLGDCQDVIARCRPRLWMHGHTHTPCDYVVGETRVLCNPMGYPGEKSGYDPKLMVEL